MRHCCVIHWDVVYSCLGTGNTAGKWLKLDANSSLAARTRKSCQMRICFIITAKSCTAQWFYRLILLKLLFVWLNLLLGRNRALQNKRLVNSYQNFYNWLTLYNWQLNMFNCKKAKNKSCTSNNNSNSHNHLNRAPLLNCNLWMLKYG